MSDSSQDAENNRVFAHVGAKTYCPRCDRELPFASSVCEHCNPTLEAHSALDPNDPCGIVRAEGAAYREASQHPDKPIVVIGMWLLWGPILCSVFACDVIYIYALPDLFRHGEIIMIVVGLVILGPFTYISSALLYRTTTNFLRRKDRVA